jgi:phage terminase large subunit-like protein
MASKAELRRLNAGRLSEEEARAVIAGMDARQRQSLRTHWHLQAHEGQLPPQGAWWQWMIMAGRGFGKTRGGAEWVRAVVEADPCARIALVGASLGEARAVMVEGPSGLIALARRGHRPRFEPSRGLLRWPSGAEARLYSAAEPEALRGPQHSHAWCDELGKWPLAGDRASVCWDNLMLGLRLGARPQVVVTTTPRAVPLVKRLAADPDVHVTRGRMADNARNLAPGFAAAMRRSYGKTLLGRQELDGELIEDIEGALWSRALLEQCRVEGPAEGFGAYARRVVVGVDPPASANGDACGIVVAELGADGLATVRADCSVEKAGPEQWARAVAHTAAAWRADRVVAEKNNGGDMVMSVLRAAGLDGPGALPVKLVHASRGKAARAEPVAALYEAGRVRHAGMFARLEDELCGIMAGGGYAGPGRSPDRADALVWALTELMLGTKSEPRVQVL